MFKPGKSENFSRKGIENYFAAKIAAKYANELNHFMTFHDFL